MKINKGDIKKIGFLPHYTTLLLNKNQELIDNLYLKLYKYAYINIIKKKDNEIKKIQPYFSIYNLNNNFKEYNQVLLSQDKRYRYIFEKSGMKYIQFTISQQSRWAIGIGEESAYGNLLIPVVHPLYGIPYIPASTLKGLVRRGWIDRVCNVDKEAEEVHRLFGLSNYDNSDEGTVGSAGQLIFFDSYPVPGETGIGRIVKDVITSHYPEYYGNFGKVPPGDDQNPVPIEFYSIENFKFNIYIGSRKDLGDDETNKLKEVMEYIFKEIGVGAKKAYGYGRGKVLIV